MVKLLVNYFSQQCARLTWRQTYSRPFPPCYPGAWAEPGCCWPELRTFRTCQRPLEISTREKPLLVGARRCRGLGPESHLLTVYNLNPLSQSIKLWRIKHSCWDWKLLSVTPLALPYAHMCYTKRFESSSPLMENLEQYQVSTSHQLLRKIIEKLQACICAILYGVHMEQYGKLLTPKINCVLSIMRFYLAIW